MDFKDQWISFIHQLQNDICAALEKSDGKATFIEDAWERPEGGGGKTRVISNGNVIEKGGVNTSVVFGDVTDLMRTQLKINGDKWFACGLSLVIHPSNPFVPTVHCNYRMFELYDKENNVVDRWFGGGTDLTPYYLLDEDARHFHLTYKNVCDTFDPDFYPDFKKQCDNYFVNTHRNNERRGIGGIFYDYQKVSLTKDLNFWISFAKACGYAFIESYIPIIEKRKNTPYTDKHKHWQEIRRGRYTEFNLVHDRGTIFGLKTNGRIESILMSLPPTVRFEYNYQPEKGSEEDKLLQACLIPKEWVNSVNNISDDEWASKVNTC
ncbi:oxygen-dependent coproporphyrinogen oxidase [Ferruginibacter lapsinanis]|uniref:oxygen-dependent coproporphyrinogen oxidase n=1 Tax=Ferruginibacter lapsinanis TaxID=563172 RepID=UPI001E2B26CB|nr:oxygen-dependent coproporphyrinogen oxidase [Ferruginibacter lapsinanis]UEG48978.1 oxygen-dependent coproporphyrinogen oxidase [Ferruginibacter lapsinanis]